MRGGDLIREARRRAGLTQKDLAEQLGTTQAVIARWESGRRSPQFDRVVEAIRACGLELAVRIVRFDEGHDSLIDETLRLTPEQRLRRLVASRAGLEDLVKSVRRD